MQHYERRVYRLPAAREDELAAALWGRGALGCEVTDDAEPGRIRLVAYFPAGEAPAFDAAWRLLEVEEAGGDSFEGRDWLAEYRAHSRPLAVGRRFVVDPRDLDDPAAREPIDPGQPGRIVLRIPAQNAFGTGSHASTRLVVELLERHPDVVAGSDILDVGTGSAILALVALHLGAQSVVGYDPDAEAVVTARLNARRNPVPGRPEPALFAGGVQALGAERPPAFDLALINVLPERVIADYPSIRGRLRAGGQVISSGNLVEHRDAWLGRLAGLGLVPRDERGDGEWIAFLLRAA